jgi:hypothetical protein
MSGLRIGSDAAHARTWWMRMLFPKSVRIICGRCGEHSLIRKPKPGTKTGTTY